jgi:predicted metal-dependent phosphoesterase TrpH
MRFDLHVHTQSSPDSWIPEEKLAGIAKRAGLAGFAVTDHSSVSGWKKAAEAAKKHGVMAVQGEEVGVKPKGRTVGEVIGLFMNEFVDGRGRSAAEVMDLLARQDAVIVLPHPFDPLRHVFPEGELREIAVKTHAVEVFNARSMVPGYNAKAKAFATEFGLSETGGSDAHVSWEVGRAFTEADAQDAEELRSALLKGKTKAGGKLHNFFTARAVATLAKLKHNFSKAAGMKK